MSEYKGVIVEESLEDNRILNDFKIIEFRISKEENPADRWHLYTVQVSKEDIVRLSKNIKQKWYMHFWKGRNVIAIFKDKKFEFNFDDKSTWKPVVEYGLSLGIPKEQLDFPID
ncbi:MAG TPA: hypothetical protein VMX18_00005 [Candidatus Bipolaricaulota bacterium]|nr:hypothetical protein [Candidatus Bipolaricaulota bacterium]